MAHTAKETGNVDRLCAMNKMKWVLGTMAVLMCEYLIAQKANVTMSHSAQVPGPGPGSGGGKVPDAYESKASHSDCPDLGLCPHSSDLVTKPSFLCTHCPALSGHVLTLAFPVSGVHPGCGLLATNIGLSLPEIPRTPLAMPTF